LVVLTCICKGRHTCVLCVNGLRNKRGCSSELRVAVAHLSAVLGACVVHTKIL
jgi:hypothetical protein